MDAENRTYHSLEDPTIRATAIAHAIRMRGCAPPPGATIGFAMQLQQVDALGLTDAIARHAEAKNLSEKVWFSFKITEQDLERGLTLVASPEFTGHPGKKSSFPVDLTKLKL